jgi:hypothetical protein
VQTCSDLTLWDVAKLLLASTAEPLYLHDIEALRAFVPRLCAAAEWIFEHAEIQFLDGLRA